MPESNAVPVEESVVKTITPVEQVKKVNPRYANITEVGSGTLQEDITAPKPQLDKVSEYEFVTLHNPLPFKFVGRVGQSRDVNAPIRIVSDGVSDGGAKVTEDTLAQAGLSLRNADHKAKLQVTSKIEIAPNGTINLRGDEAKVIVRQLTNEVMAYEDETLRIGNPTYRASVESRIIVRVSGIEELMNGGIATPREQINAAIEQSNTEVAFPGLSKGKPAKTAAQNG